jgi:thiamine pyrophosphate-dependent acetolactate synthase large subunit-like protein
MAKRREFLKGVGVAAASGIAAGKVAAQQAGTNPSSNTVAAVPPTSHAEALEMSIPEGYSQEQAHKYFVQSPGSDFMVDVIKSLDIDYIASNPGSSFRGLQESISIYGDNKKPEFLTCLHEETAAAMSHGYAKVAFKPMAVACHGTVGLQHASMAVYNAYCDRAPMVIFAGNHMEATGRRPGAEWSHSALDCVKLVRDFIKWDDTPLSLTHFAESTVRAYKLAVTPPMGPVVLQLDGHLQEADTFGQVPSIPKFSMPQPPHGDTAALREAARMLVNAENPVILAGRTARTPEGLELLVELAEALQAPVSGGGRMNFPNTHYLSQGGSGLIRQADVILGLEENSLWDNVNAMRDLVHRTEVRVARDDVKLISLSSEDLFLKSNYQTFQRFQPVDLDITGDAQSSLPYLIEEVKRQTTRSHRSKLQDREARYRKSYQQSIDGARQSAAMGWDLRPVSVDRVAMELWDVMKDRDWSYVSRLPSASRLWKMDKHYHHIGGSGGAGVGYNLPASIGAALANRDLGRFSVSIQPDGDSLYAPGALWTAAHHRIPILIVMHNNRAYHREVMHLQRMATRRQRGADGKGAKVGNVFEDPFINFATLAQSMGVYSEGPVTDPADLGPAIQRATAIVDQGLPALVDVVCQPA